MGWLLYAADNNDSIVPNIMDPLASSSGLASSWVDLPLHSNALPGATNVNLVMRGLLFPYDNSLKVYICPGQKGIYDSNQGIELPLPPARSFSISCHMCGVGPGPNGGVDRAVLPGNPPDALANIKTTQINRPGPSQAFVFMDESECTIGAYGGFWVTDIELSFAHPGALQSWSWNYPSFRHGGVASVSFADGHSELHKWLDPDPSRVKPGGGYSSIDGPMPGRDLRWVRDRFIYPP